MNAIGYQRERVEPEEWERPEMRAALAERDIMRIYRLLQNIGFSQQRIAALTGQSQPEVSAIIHGRKVMAYDVLARIADGLGVPRGYMGLAYAGESGQQARPVQPAGPSAPGGEPESPFGRRGFLGQAAAITLGAAVVAADLTGRPATAMAAVPTPAPGRVGMSEVEQVVQATATLRGLDHRHGGGACRDVVLAQLAWSARLLESDCAQEVGRRMRLAVADLHNLAGWTSLDVGLDGAARQFFERALELARQGGDLSLVANVLYRTGRISLHRGDAAEALRLFQLGQLAAQESGSPLAEAVLAANQGWAYGRLGEAEASHRMLGQAEDALAAANLATAPAWFRFFDESDLEALRGQAYLALGATDPRYTERAIGQIDAAADHRMPEMARSKAFDLSSLALAHLRQGDIDHGVRVGNRAVDAVDSVQSARVIDWLRPLAAMAAVREDKPDARDLAERLTQVISRSGVTPAQVAAI
ncbi:MAG TPA: transcriptional regulator [Mycobacteriales bacterium]|nr:transcriptional regulator [Mycobacteriales bacterium]